MRSDCPFLDTSTYAEEKTCLWAVIENLSMRSPSSCHDHKGRNFGLATGSEIPCRSDGQPLPSCQKTGKRGNGLHRLLGVRACLAGPNYRQFFQTRCHACDSASTPSRFSGKVCGAYLQARPFLLFRNQTGSEIFECARKRIWGKNGLIRCRPEVRRGSFHLLLSLPVLSSSSCLAVKLRLEIAS